MTTFDMNNAVENALNPKVDVYAIYLRKSREDLKAEARGEGETLSRHRKILTDYAARRGIYVERIYEEIESGETIKDRPKMQQLIEDCYAGKYRGILVMEISRLSRGNQGDAQTILDCLKYANNNKGLLVSTPTKTYDINRNPDDEEYMEFELFMSRREYKMITKRMQRGKEQSIVEGCFISSHRPYGYNIIETQAGRTLTPHPTEAEIVRKIFDWRVNHNMSPGDIARKLTRQGVPSYSGTPEWHRSTVRTILQNPVYRGKVKWYSVMRVKSMVDGKVVEKKKKMTDSDHYMEYDGKHEALVSDELFETAQKGFRRDNTKANLTLKNPLAGLLVCAKCQKAMFLFDYKKTPGSRARLNHAESQVCKVKSAYFSDVMDAFVYGLKMHLKNYMVMIDNKPVDDEEEIKEQIAALEAEKKRIKKILSNMFDDYENQIYTANEFVERKAKHNKRLEEIEKEIDELTYAIPEKKEYEEKIVYLHDAIEMLKSDDVPASFKNEYLKQFVQRVEFSRENDEEFILDIHLY